MQLVFHRSLELTYAIFDRDIFLENLLSFSEIVTTVAVTSPGQNEWAADLERQRNQSDVQSMPDLSGSGLSGKQSTNNLEMFRPSSADLLGNHLSKEPENIMTVPITKGKFYSFKSFSVSKLIFCENYFSYRTILVELTCVLAIFK